MPVFAPTTYHACSWRHFPAKITSNFKPKNLVSGSAVEPNDTEKTIVIHPGSMNLRIGRCTDGLPYVIPHILARRVRNFNEDSSFGTSKTNKSEEMQVSSENETLENFIKESDFWIKQSQKAAKLRPVQQANTQVLNYNKNAESQIIPDHNDPYRIDWTEIEENTQILIGEDVVRLPDHIARLEGFFVRKPLIHKQRNTEDYSSIQEWMSDIETLWSMAIEGKMGIEKKYFSEYHILLIIPDIFEKNTLQAMVDTLIFNMGFKGISVHQESLCSTYGAGLSNACVIDVGAESTSISCVEDSYCIPESRISLNYGGENITSILNLLLRRSYFPYAECDLNKTHDRNIIRFLKEHLITLNLNDLTVEVYDCYCHVPEQETRLYKFKTYDEPMMAALSLFYPQVYNIFKNSTRIKNSGTINFAKCRNFGDWISALRVHQDEKHDAGFGTAKSHHFFLTPPKEISNDTKEESSNENEIENNDTIADENSEVSSDHEETEVEEEEDEAMSTDALDEDFQEPEFKSTVLPPLDKAVLFSTLSTSAKLKDNLMKKRRENKIRIKLPNAPSDSNLPSGQVKDTDSTSSSLQGDFEQQTGKKRKLNELNASNSSLKASSQALMWDVDENRIKKMLSSILLVGGGLAQVPNAQNVLADRIFQATFSVLPAYGITPETSTLKIEIVNVMATPREMDPSSLCWKGGAVAARLESVKESCWVSKEDYKRWGLLAIKERCLFPLAF